MSGTNAINKMAELLDGLWQETWKTSWELIRITVPVLLATKLLEEIGAIQRISQVMAPLMSFVGLPDALGFVWGTALLTSIYGGLGAFAALAGGMELTVAQVTILCSLMLIAHSLPLELSICKKAGSGALFQTTLRLGGALIYGFFLDTFCRFFALWQEKAELVFSTTPEKSTALNWIFQQAYNICLIILIIFGILLIMRLLKMWGILSALERMLAPVLPFFGMGEKAAPITVIGMIMGLGYGGALIIQESSTGKLSREELFFSLALMGLCHALLEDTLLLAAIGGKISGILWGRMIFSLVMVYGLVQIHRLIRWRQRRQIT